MADEVSAHITAATSRFIEVWTSDDPLAGVDAAKELTRAADDTLRAAVDRARAASRTWQEIGDLLGTSRQAAFQRFGRPIDPRTGTPMTQATPLPDATEKAVDLVVEYVEGHYEAVRSHFDEQMLDAVSLERLSDGHAQISGLVGAYEGMGEPYVRMLGKHTVVNVPLRFEAGNMIAQVTYSSDGQVAGLFVKLADVS